MKPPREMTDDELRTEIALLLGWTFLGGVGSEIDGIPPGVDDRIDPVPSWTTGIAAAWDLVEIMAEAGNVEIAHIHNNVSRWNIDLPRFDLDAEDHVQETSVGSAWGNNLPRAICECFITWKREEAERGR